MKIFLFILASGFTLFSQAYACSCICNHNKMVSELVKGKKVFWGLPIQSTWNWGDNYSSQLGFNNVNSSVVVLEGYGQLEINSKLQINSRTEDGRSCGVQLRIGVPQLIVTFSEANYTSSCTCLPPLKATVKYLQEGIDTFIPDPQDCDKTELSAKMQKKCEVFEDDYSFEREEFGRIYKSYRSLLAE